MKKLYIVSIILAFLGWAFWSFAIPPLPQSPAGSGTGDVTGPASPTTNNIVKFTGTGKGTDNTGVIFGTMTNGKVCTYNSTGTLLSCNTDAYQVNLSLLAGTMTNTYLCTYTAAGTLLSCNTDPATFQPYLARLATMGAIAIGANNSIYGVNGAGVEGWYTTHQHDDSAAQFYSATASKGTLKFDQTGISDTKLVTIKHTATVDTIFTPTYAGTGGIHYPAADITEPFEDRITATFDGGGTTAIVADTKAVMTVPFNCVITGGQILASKKLGTSGNVSIKVNIWREATAANYDGGSAHPAVTDTICGAGTCPTVTAAQRAAISVASWDSVTLTKGDILIFNAETVTDTVLANVTLYVSKR